MKPRARGDLGRSKSAVIYARVSSKEQEKEGYSIPSQLKLLTTYAREHGIEIVATYQDVETAKKSGREHFDEMLGFLRGCKKCRTVLVEKTDRLYRNIKDWVTLDELDLEVHFVKENFVLSQGSRSTEKFVHGIKVLMAKQYVDNLSEEASKGMLEKAEQGVWPSQAPLGYQNVTLPDKRKVIQPDPDLGPVVRRIFERYASGDLSLSDVTRKARDEGLCYRKTGGKVHKSAVHQILTNPIYFGEFLWKGKRYTGSHEPLVSRELFEKVQEMLVKKGNRRNLAEKHTWAFQGLLTCGYCGCSLVAERKKEKYTYYHCTQAKGKCALKWTREEIIDQEFQKAIEAITLDKEVADILIRALKESHEDEQRFHNENVSRLRIQYDKTQNRLDKMYVDKLDGKVTEDFYERNSGEWRKEQEEILRRIESHQGANRTYLDEGVRILELAKKAASLYSRQPMLEKRRLLDFVLSNSIWRDGELVPEYRKPFDILASGKRAAEVGGVEKGPDEIWLPKSALSMHFEAKVIHLFHRRPRCSETGCQGLFYAKGLCRGHYKAWRRGTLRPSTDPSLQVWRGKAQNQ